MLLDKLGFIKSKWYYTFREPYRNVQSLTYSRQFFKYCYNNLFRFCREVLLLKISLEFHILKLRERISNVACNTRNMYGNININQWRKKHFILIHTKEHNFRTTPVASLMLRQTFILFFS